MLDVIIYRRKVTNPLVEDCLNAVEGGFRTLGAQLQVLPEEQYKPSLIAVTFGIYKKVMPVTLARKAIHDQQSAAGLNNLVIERGFLRRERYHSIGWDGQNGRANFYNKEMKSDRWNSLNIQVKPWDLSGQHILVCGQVPWDTNVQHIDYIQWVTDLLVQLRQTTDCPVIFRPHPCQPKAVPIPPGIQLSTGSLEQDISNAKCVMAFNSNSCVDALLAGKPVFVFDRGAMSYQLANTSLTKLHTPVTPDRKQWLYDLSYTQWTLDELAQGRFWETLGQRVNYDKCINS